MLNHADSDAGAGTTHATPTSQANCRQAWRKSRFG